MIAGRCKESAASSTHSAEPHVYADVLLIIADISGYTRFMVANDTELQRTLSRIAGEGGAKRRVRAKGRA